jgi:2-polyprenyl-3-methyl-5-hydroxy-6-metoxy-1,4-benzoquinol methylase
VVFLTPERQQLLAQHSPALAPGRTDMRAYLEASRKRYEAALAVYRDCGGTLTQGARVLDVGGFMAAFPLALSRLGFDVTISEAFSYYGGAFDDLRAFVEAEGITVWDVDLTQPQPARPERFELVANMAMIEHLADSPRPLMQNMRGLLAKNGRVMIEVPNLGYWPTRVRALRGQSIHPPLADVYRAEPPFLGHHREYTAHELEELFELSGFRMERLICFNYSWNFQGPLLARLGKKLFYEWPMRRFPALREVLLACGSLGGAVTASRLPD